MLLLCCHLLSCDVGLYSVLLGSRVQRSSVFCGENRCVMWCSLELFGMRCLLCGYMRRYRLVLCNVGACARAHTHTHTHTHALTHIQPTHTHTHNASSYNAAVWGGGGSGALELGWVWCNVCWCDMTSDELVCLLYCYEGKRRTGSRWPSSTDLNKRTHGVTSKLSGSANFLAMSAIPAILSRI